ncbi:hypothetical protein HELRODRAFT_77785 [Helobdella robusta]|uniref:Uncharacterized protein n=1 Tax=Helobdella robusta TaxID=6412 RepID=T1G339_HELRO|nr:hypothetical protein HELRODRAFT_77785 [Helobdella robusta]ESO05330.1 hypothetical protein HELRODRAFT_77785 [Helobdella robusta]
MFKEHEGCWQLRKRGSVGESIIHLAVLYSKSSHIYKEITKVLLNIFPKLALDLYEGEEYYGMSGLHIAIVNGDLELVKLFVEKGSDISQRATGKFFLPDDQKNGPSTESTNYYGRAYYGEYPLAFAACFGYESIYDYLMEQGADPDQADSFGNTVLHMMVICNQTAMLSAAMRHQFKRPNLCLANQQNLTPLTLASKLGRMEIFSEIIELQSYEIWRYSNITCSVHPLGPLDTIGQNGAFNPNAALVYITNGVSENHLEMLDDGIIKQLLLDKWKNFAKRRFLERVLLAVFHLLVLSVAIYLRDDVVFVDYIFPPNVTDIIRYFAEVVVLAYCLVTVVIQVFEMKTQGLSAYVQRETPAKCVFNVSCVFIIICLPVRCLHYQTAEKILLALAAPCAWANLLFYARLDIFFCFFIGVFVVVFYQMLRGDLARFGIIYIIFFIGFGQSFSFLFKTTKPATPDCKASQLPFETIGGTIMKLFEMTLGDYQYESFSRTANPILTKLIFILFAIMVPILLLSMLIAMFVHTYEQIIKRSEKEWKRQWAKIILVLERTFSPKQLVHFQENYSVCIGGNTNPIRGLMVIKNTFKTKARQRKDALANWKVRFLRKLFFKFLKYFINVSKETVQNGKKKVSFHSTLTCWARKFK